VKNNDDTSPNPVSLHKMTPACHSPVMTDTRLGSRNIPTERSVTARADISNPVTESRDGVCLTTSKIRELLDNIRITVK